MAAEDYGAHLAALGIDATAVRERDDGTVAATIAQPEAGASTMELPLLAIAEPMHPGGNADLLLERKLAEGGMGQIWAATQTGLGRRVAVKRARRDRPSARHQLVQEGRTLGSLEHPNIVPVHALGRTQAAEPLVVMKYIEGTVWSELLQPLYPREGAAPDEVIERHLGILVQVCHAVEFAHARGVIHRDLKPENVMIGAFGEVYVLDWGLAVSLRPGSEAPPAHEVKTLCGTPAYMAPEMAACAGERLDERTDVYLLGAVLHKLVTGQARHDAPEPIRRLELAYNSAPVSYGAWVPSEIARICNVATDLDRDRRHRDVQSFREAVMAFLRHRSSGALVDRVHERLEQVAAALDAELSDASTSVLSVDALVGEAEFGLQQALRGWPDNPEARAGLQRLRELMIELELRREHPKRVAVLLAELPEPRPELERRMHVLEAELMRRQGAMKSLQRLRFESDLTVTARSRRRIALALGSLLGVSICTLFVLRVLGLHKAGYLDGVVLMVGFSLASFGARLGMGKSPNVINRRILQSVSLNAMGVTGELVLAWWLDIEFTAALAIAMATTGIAGLVASATIDRRLYWTAGCFLLTAIGVGLWPPMRGLVLAVGCFLAFAAGAWAWRKLDDPEPEKR